MIDDNTFAKNERASLIRVGISKVLEALECSVNPFAVTPFREGIVSTPDRVQRAYMDELFKGYDIDPAEYLKVTFETERVDEMILVRNIPVYSMCEHHMLPFIGQAHVAYIPNDNRVVGISKLARVVDAYARRLQVQERLTQQVADIIDDCLQPKGVGVLISCEHLCMTMRGIRARGAQTVTSCLKGVFRNDDTRKEFLSLTGE